MLVLRLTVIGRRGPVLWAKSEEIDKTPLEICYGAGVGFIGFQPTAAPDAKTRPKEVIAWNHDHTEASFTISTYFDGLNGTGYAVVVRKIGNDWVVVRMKMAYVS